MDIVTNVLLDPIKLDIRRLEQEVNDLYKTVYKGNGNPSLVSQTLTLDGSIKHLENTMEQRVENLEEEFKLRINDNTSLISEKFKHLELQISNEFEHRKIKTQGAWKMRVALISAVTALCTSFVPLLLQTITSIFKH